MNNIVSALAETDVNLAPGEFYFGEGYTRIHTLLGSCVAITMWHPLKHIGGMCHYLLPSRGLNQKSIQGCYADEAIDLFLLAIKEAHTRPHEYEVKLFGGGNMFDSLRHKVGSVNVSRDNIISGHNLVKKNGFSSIKATDVGGTQHRKIYLELWNGDVWVQRGSSSCNGQA